MSSISVNRGRKLYGGEQNVESRALQATLGGDANLVEFFAKGATIWSLIVGQAQGFILTTWAKSSVTP